MNIVPTKFKIKLAKQGTEELYLLYDFLFGKLNCSWAGCGHYAYGEEGRVAINQDGFLYVFPSLSGTKMIITADSSYGDKSFVEITDKTYVIKKYVKGLFNGRHGIPEEKVNEFVEEYVGYLPKYRKYDYCEHIGCEYLDKLKYGDKIHCKMECSAYDYHDYLQERGFSIVETGEE